MALDQPPPDEPVDESARRRRRPTDRLGQLANGQGAPIGQHVERGELREPEAELSELARETDHELPPQRPAHRHPLADLAYVLKARSRRKDWGGQVGFEPTGDGSGGCGAAPLPRTVTIVGHAMEGRPSPGRMQPCTVVALDDASPAYASA